MIQVLLDLMIQTLHVNQEEDGSNTANFQHNNHSYLSGYT